MDPDSRPSKRPRTNQAPDNNGLEKAKQGKNPSQRQNTRDLDHPRGRGKSKYRQPQSSTFSVSGIHSDDVGIFVTSDKGQEKNCLQELSDLLGEFFDGRNADSQHDEKTANESTADKDVDIEADIQAELDSLRPQKGTACGVVQTLSLVTLDIPCVSFVRFPTGTTVDPVQVVRKLCLNASDKDSTAPRSRYIRRLTPVSRIRKTMNDGLESLCAQILPQHFQIDSEKVDTPGQTPCKFAIRPSIRNNNKINRDDIIHLVADKITSMGQDKHKVDLKGYDKLILVDVYRNVVGMSVVGSEYESLKRFNLAEIHASHLDEGDKGASES